MAFKPYKMWLKDGQQVASDRITGDGVWEIDTAQGLLSYEACNVFVKRPKGGADPGGAAIQMGIRIGGSGVAPSPITDALLTIPALSEEAEAAVPERVIPQGRICVTVSGYVNPFELVVVQ